MNTDFLCRECGFEHTDPAEARLGYTVTCVDCTEREIDEARSMRLRNPAQSEPALAA